MLRERIDEYLDGSLDQAGVRAVEATVAQDATAARLLSQMKSERALRGAAYESFMPTASESAALAARMMDEARHAPVGQVGYWIRRGAAVAAAVVVVAGSFMAGQMSAPEKIREVQVSSKPEVVYNVVSVDRFGVTSEKSFANVDERNAYVSKALEEGSTVTASVPPEMFPLGHM